MTKYEPTVTVNGRDIGCVFGPEGDPVVLDDLRVDWGRTNLYDPTDPSQVTAEFLDPDGSWGSDPTLFGSPFVVRTELGTLFRGRVDGIEMRVEGINDSSPYVGSDVWRVTVTASDVIADLAKRVAPGWETKGAKPWNGPNVNYDAWITATRAKYGVGFWYEANSEDRRRAIQDRMAEQGIDTTIETVDFATIVPSGGNWAKYYRECTRSATLSLYDMVRSVQARAPYLVHSNYFPDTDIIDVGVWPHRGGLLLTYSNSLIKLSAGSGSTQIYIVACSNVGLDEQAITAAIEHNVTSLKVTGGSVSYTTQTVQLSDGSKVSVDVIPDWAYADTETAVKSPGGGSAQYEAPILPADLYWKWSGDTSPTQSETAEMYAKNIGPLVAELNGKLRPPKLIFDFEQFDFGSAQEQTLLSTWTGEIPFAFPGSVFEPLIGWGPMFQYIGGELRYRQGWQVTGTFAPALSSSSGSLAINQIVTIDTPTISQYDDTIALSTLGEIVKGLN